MTTAAASDTAAVTFLENLAVTAGRLVMAIFNGDMDVSHKADSSPVTEADRASERYILEGLRRQFPTIPCVAEEECGGGIEPGRLGQEFFLVDPLDGTREFVNRNADFTVNIALVRDAVPILGVVYAPASRKLYSGRPGHADAIEVSADHEIMGRRRILVREGIVPLTVVASRSHRTPETDAYIRKFAAAEIVSVGSSLKFCMIAAGQADLYPRFGRTMEWDTAAGDAVLRAAGGMTTTTDGAPLIYGKRKIPDEADFANPSFIASGNIGPH